MPSKEWTGPELLRFSSAYWSCCALQAGVILDVFTVLDEAGGAVKAEALAARLECDARGLSMLLDALTALGFLDRENGAPALPESARRYLSRRSSEFLGYIIMHQADIMPGWARLADAVRTGKKTREQTSPRTQSAEERENFLMGMFNIAVAQAETVASALDLSGRTRLLDLGGGPGTYAVYFCRRNPSLAATIFDLPSSAPIAEKIVKQFGLGQRIDFVGGDFLQDTLPTGYDAVWLSQVLHGESPEDAAKLVARGAGTLNPGGLLCVQEFIIDDDREGPLHSTLFSLNMLVGTHGGQAYTQSEIAAMMEKAGARDIRRLEAELPPGCGIMVGVMRTP